MNSPCIDAGNGEGAPAKDIDGDLRPQESGVDMGADEYVNLKLNVKLNKLNFVKGETLRARCHVVNDAASDIVNVNIFVIMPNGRKKDLRNIVNYEIAADFDRWMTIFTYIFKGNEPAGEYKFVVQLLDNVTGELLSQDIEPFIFVK